MADQSPNLESLFLAALEITSPEERASFLDQACKNDQQLRADVEQMLAAQPEIGRFLESPLSEFDATIIPGVAHKDLAASLDAGLAPAFGEDDAVVLGDAGHSVLRSLGQSINFPRVVLRESEAEAPDPITRPSSPEVPKSDSDSRYQLQGEIARGGMGAILKGRDTDLGRDLAIKVLLDSHKDKPEVVQRFVEEAQIGGQLQHPGIAPIYELGQFKDKRPFFAMKLVKGQTLSKLLADREDPADERGRFIGIFEQVCQTMAYAHSRGVIHRDLKPANIMVGAFGEVQVMDWGLAKVLQVGGVADEKKSQALQQGQSVIQTMRSGVGSDVPAFGSAGSHTQMGSVMGTPAYMPPEQALGEIDNMDERADVFGLGAILCEILTGQPPYVAEDGTRVFRMASRGKLDDAFSRLDDCGADEDLVALTRHCLELEPKDRPRDAGVLAERVTEYLESVETRLREAEVERAAEAARADAEAAQASAERARAEAEAARANEESKRRRTSLALAASVLLLISFGSGGWLYMQRQEVKRQEAAVLEQTKHAAEMEALAEQRDEQRKAAEQAEATAVTARQDAEREREVAVEAKRIAEAAEEEGRKLLYATDMQLVDALLKDEESSARQILSRLNAHDPGLQDHANPDEDLRGFEWHYFKSVLDKRSTTFDGFDQPVVGSALTAEGELVTLDNDGKLRRFDAATRIETRPVLDLKQRRQLGLKALSADGRMAALAVGDKVHLVDTTTGAELAPAIEAATRYGVIFSPDAAMLITVDAKIAWWDTATGTQFASLDVGLDTITDDRGTFARTNPHPVSVSADGLTVAVGGQGNTSQAWSAYRMNPDTGNVAVLQDKFNKDGQGTMRTLAVTPDGKSVAIAMSFAGHLHFFDVISGKLVGGNRSEHASSIATIGFNPKNHEMVTGSIDGVLKYWKDYRQLLSAETLDAPETRSLQGHDKSIVQAVIAADGKRIISSSLDQTTRIWDLQTQTASLAQPVTTLTSYRSVYSPDGLLIVGAGGDREIRVCEAATGRLVRSIHVEGTEPLEVVAVSPENRLLATGRGRNSEPKLFELWDLESGERRSLEVKTMYAEGGVTQLAFSPSGEHLVACFGDFDLYMAQAYEKEVFPLLVFDVASGQLIQDLRGHQNAVMNITFSRDGKLLASASHDRTVRIWDTETWQTIHVLANPDKSDRTTATENGVADVAFSPDGTRLAMASHAGNVHIFNTQSGALMETLRGHAGMVNAVRFSPDGRTLVSGGADGTTRLWNAATWRQLTALDSGSAAFRPQSLRFSPDGRQLLAAGPQTVFWSTQPSALNQPEQLAGNLKPLLKSKSLFRNRVRLLSESLQLHEALELLDSEEPLVQAALAATRANWHASQRRWPEAAAEFAVLQKLDPDAAHAWLQSRGLLHLTRALFMQNQPALASELLAVASQQLQADGMTRSNLPGIQYVPDTAPVKLTLVVPNSPAARAGLRVGDLISKVNDVELTADNAGQFDTLLGGEPGTKLQLTVQLADSDEPQQIELTKELVYSDQRFGEQIARLRSEVEQRLAENMDDMAMRQLRAELLGLLGNVPAQIADYTAAIETLSTRPRQHAPDDKDQLAKLYRRRGDAYLNQKQWQPAVDDYARVVTDQTMEKDLLTNQALALTEVLTDSTWTVLRPTPQGMNSEGGATLTLLADGSILASGKNPDQDAYQITANIPPQRITAIRLDAIPDTSLPHNGPGRSLSNGLFTLHEFRVTLNGTPHHPEGVAVSYAISDGYRNIIDGIIDDERWGIWPQAGQQHSAVFATDFELAADDVLVLELIFSQGKHLQYNLGRFRLLASDDPGAYANTEKRFAAKQIDDPFTRLAVVSALDNQSKLAVQTFSRAIQFASNNEAKLAVIQQASKFDGLLKQLADLHPDESVLQVALARVFLERGEKAFEEQRPDDARADLNRARTLLEATLDSNPENASAAEVLTEALLAIERTENEAQWTVLTPTEMKSEGGATLTLQADGSILASGKNPDQDTYQITANVPPQHIKAIRLEAIPDPSLPHNGPGRWPGHGNFHLNEFRVLVNGTPHQPEGIMVSFSDPNAKGHYRQIIDGTVDGNLWSIHPRTGQQHSAIFATDLELGPDDTLTLELVSSRGDYPQHNLGRFRLLASDDPGAYVETEQRFAARKLTDPWAKLAVAYALGGQNELAVQTFSQALQLADSEEAKQSTVQQTALFDGFLEQLADLHPDEPLLQIALSTALQERGEKAIAEQRPVDALRALNRAQTLRDRVMNEISTNLEWFTPPPSEMKSQGGADLTLLDDQSILASGTNPDTEIYEVIAPVAAGKYTAIRLIGLMDRSLPGGGHSRHQDGNVVMTGFEAEFANNASPEDWQPIQFVQAWANHSQSNTSPEHLFDKDPRNSWTSAGFNHKDDRTLVFTSSTPFGENGEIRLRVRLRFESKYPRQVLGRFQLAVTSSREPVRWTQISSEIQNARLTDLDFALARTQIASILTDEASATEQWDLAKADWLRALEERPDRLQQAFDEFRKAEQWSTAAEFGQRLLEQDPDNSMLWLRVGVIVYLAEPDGACSEFCSRLTKQFGETNDATDVGRLIKPLLLKDSAPSDAAMHFGDVIAGGLEDNTTPQSGRHWRWGALALLAYRSNDPEATVQFVEKSAESSPVDFSQALNLAVLAMAQFELNESDSARKSLEEASQLITRLKENPNNKGHHDVLIAEILFREAEAKINSNDEPPKVNADK